MNDSALLQIPLLTAAECDRARQSVLDLRAHWAHRHSVLPIYMLGTSSYMEAIGDEPPYARMARESNLLLRQHFGWLYGRLLMALAQVLRAPVVHAQGLALPGFHIYLAAKAFEQPLAPLHFDLQYRFHDWQGLDADLEHPISFTLPIALPTHGGGLNLWDLTLAERRAHPDATPEDLARARTLSYHPYRRGDLVLHSGHLLHQMAPGVDIQPQDERITLQGHGVCTGGLWRVYW